MTQILILGAGFVARPLVSYLLQQPDIHLTIATRTLSKAKALIEENHPRANAEILNVENSDALKKFISQADIVVSLLPWVHHLKVASLCLDLKKHLVTTSYVKPEMAAMDKDVRKNKLLFLNEIGVDPGIDHMAAMSVIDRVKQQGGQILEFYSYCGGLPAPAHNTNPLGYKFSWSPAGMLLAALNNGQYLKDGRLIKIPAQDLFKHYWLVDVPGAGTFEAYVNRDALPYLKIYGIEKAKSIYRGTLRNIGHCESWDYFKKLGLLDQQQFFDFEKTSLKQLTAQLIQGRADHLIEDLAQFLKIPVHSVTLKKLAWLGLLDEKKLPLKNASVFEMFAHVLQNKLVYKSEETDCLIQHHKFIAKYPDGQKKTIKSTMTQIGIAGKDTAMSLTVGLPAAIAVKMLAQGKIVLTGVHRPVIPEIYKPVLAELSAMNIHLTEMEN